MGGFILNATTSFGVVQNVRKFSNVLKLAVKEFYQEKKKLEVSFEFAVTTILHARTVVGNAKFSPPIDDKTQRLQLAVDRARNVETIRDLKQNLKEVDIVGGVNWFLSYMRGKTFYWNRGQKDKLVVSCYCCRKAGRVLAGCNGQHPWPAKQRPPPPTKKDHRHSKASDFKSATFRHSGNRNPQRTPNTPVVIQRKSDCNTHMRVIWNPRALGRVAWQQEKSVKKLVKFFVLLLENIFSSQCKKAVVKSHC